MIKLAASPFHVPSDPALLNLFGASGVHAASGAQTLTLFSNSVQNTTGPTDMYICYGIDANGNGSLEKSEIAGWLPYDVKVVSTAARANAAETLNNLLVTASPFTPIAANWLYSFLNDLTFSGATSTSSSVNTSDARLSHHVGALYAGQTGSIIKNVFNANSTVAQAVANSSELQGFAMDRIFANLPTFEDQLSILLPEEHKHFVLDYGNVPIVFTPLVDPDLSIAIHAATLTSLRVEFDAWRDDEGFAVARVRVSGQLTDLYDFNYDAAFPANLAAMVEAGYSGTGSAGHISKVEINFDATSAIGPRYIAP